MPISLTSPVRLALLGLLGQLPVQTQQRAREYERGGRVGPLDTRGTRISASVIGSEEYRAYIETAPLRYGCSCPADKPCKHLGALVMAILKEDPTPSTTEVRTRTAPGEEYTLCVRFMAGEHVLLNMIAPSGKILPLKRNFFAYIKPSQRDLLNAIGSYVSYIAERGMPFRDFAYILLEKMAREGGVQFYFDVEDKPSRMAGIVKPKSEIHELTDDNDEAHYEKFGYRRVRFERSHTIIDPVTQEAFHFNYNLFHPIVRRSDDRSYFYIISVPADISAPPGRYYLENIERMKGSSIRRKWEHAFDTMATAGPKLMLSVAGVENAKTKRLAIEGRLEFAYARDSADLISRDAGGEIADGAKPIFGISVSQARPANKPPNEIVQHKTGVLIKRLGEQEAAWLRKKIPFKFTSVGRVRIARAHYAEFFALEIPAAKEAGLIVRIHDNILGILARPTASLSVKGTSGIDWFEGTIQVEGLDAAQMKEVIRAYRQKEELVKLKNGNWLSVQGSGIADVLKSLDRLGISTTADGSIGKITFAQLASLEAEKATMLRTEEGAKVAQEKFQDFLSSGRTDMQPRKTLKAELRHYQLEGMQFLLHLHASGTGGILADDMGLGKTVQAIAAMNYVATLTARPPLPEGEGGRFLVVCPLAALSVWESEVAKFSPNLSVYRWHSASRSETEARKCDIVVTTFATYSLDAEKLCAVEWDFVFIDEAQFVKNFRSKSARALRKLNARSIVCLTGTPLENYLEDLWALFDLIFPGYLGTAQSFKDSYGGHLDLTDREGLMRKIQPFMLRRRKADVLKELPEKTEMLVKIPMTSEQAKVYEAARLRALTNVGKKGSALFDLLRHLTSLRRIACHPYLEEEKPDPFLSGKFEYLDSQIVELSIASEGILVFSQYTSVLRVLKQLLAKHHIEPLYLDGKTPEKTRKRLVERFQAGEAKFFLISLKAGGTALTLTRADTVIHLDPWWNPAVENQATDRAHRIGQKKHVMVYKLISEGTVEEKVLTLQAQKRELFNDLIDDEPAAAKRITREDIAGLLE